MAKLQNVRGTYDLYGEAKRKMKKVTSVGSEVVEKYGFEEIETPIFEFTEVFSRNLGETSDVVTKEMYCFEDRGGESLTCVRKVLPASCVPSFPKACSRISRSSSITAVRCSDMNGRRKGVSASLRSLAASFWALKRRRLILKSLPWLMSFWKNSA